VKGSRVDDLHVFGFFDLASLRVEDPLPDQESLFRLSSAGVGFRFVGFGGMSAELDWARALRDGANVLEGDDRFHVRLLYTF
jgi:hemolysin activation/secretion protein